MSMRQAPQDNIAAENLPIDRPIPTDFHSTLEVFVYTNLNVIMSPASLVATTIPTVTTSNTATTTSTAAEATTPATLTLTGITPTLLNALQTSVLDHFTNLTLPPDIEVITRVFFANLPPVVPTVDPTLPITPVTPIVPATSITPTTPIVSTNSTTTT